MADPKARYRVSWTATARADLESVISYIADDSVDRALDILKRLERVAGNLATLPRRGRVVPELAAIGAHGYRELISPPWRMIYRIAGKTVYVLAVLDGRRGLGDLLLERFVR